MALPPIFALAVAIFGHSATAYGQLVITPTFDSTITSDPNAAKIESTINSAIAVYEADFLNPITVNITFQETMSGLGGSSTFFGSVTYPQYRAALAAAPTTTTKTTALANLPVQANNPVDNNPNVNITTANARALGFAGFSVPTDSTISLNTSIMNLDRNSIDPSKYDLKAVASHEIDEALGFGSALNGIPNNNPNPTGAVFPLDLFRYDQNGARSLSTGTGTQTTGTRAFFSLDGTTQLAQFNQNSTGDYSDWFSDVQGPGFVPKVQDAFATPGATPDLGVNTELKGLDAIGYDFNGGSPVPEPSAAALAVLGAVSLAVFRRSARKTPSRG